jgi:hypothetical protein
MVAEFIETTYSPLGSKLATDAPDETAPQVNGRRIFAAEGMNRTGKLTISTIASRAPAFA